MLTAADTILHPNIDEEYAAKLVEKLRRTAGKERRSRYNGLN